MDGQRAGRQNEFDCHDFKLLAADRTDWVFIIVLPVVGEEREKSESTRYRQKPSASSPSKKKLFSCVAPRNLGFRK